MIFLCESCEHGYSDKLSNCPWCNSSNYFARIIKQETAACDTECYVDYWLCKFKSIDGSRIVDYQQIPGKPLDIKGLTAELSRVKIITFNGIHYDLPMITLALAGADNVTLKQASDEIILGGLRYWEFYERWRIQRPEWIDHIDLFEVLPGQGSLKAYGGKMHSRRIQDLPFEPSRSIGLFDRPVLREYCGNDLDTTLDAFNAMSAQVALREQMSAEYGVDVRSKSDAQIAEAVMKKLLPFKVEVPAIEPGTQFYYQPAPYLRFVNLPLLQLMGRSPFTINASGGIDMTAELDATNIRIGNSTYRMGIGGLHSSESGSIHVADSNHSLQDIDVTGYYPSLIVNTGIYPPQIGPIFREHFMNWRDRRVAEKRAGNIKVANSLKTLTNGTFGKLGSRYSIFYFPSGLIQVTLTGQLALLMLIELLEHSGIAVVSANTDGILVKCPRPLEWLRDQIVGWWRAQTGFETETNDYRLIASRDVNNYVAISLDGKIKLKGAYAPPEPGPSGWPNPTGQVCVDAIIAYLKHGTPIGTTIQACRDIKQFVYTRQVKGGGEWVAGEPIEKNATQKTMKPLVEANRWRNLPKNLNEKLQWVNETTGEITDLKTAYLSCFPAVEPEYLGRIARWYHAVDGGYIRYVGSGNKVATAEHCKPLMTLPDQLPEDIDYSWYIAETQTMLGAMGILS